MHVRKVRAALWPAASVGTSPDRRVSSADERRPSAGSGIALQRNDEFALGAMKAAALHDSRMASAAGREGNVVQHEKRCEAGRAPNKSSASFPPPLGLPNMLPVATVRAGTPPLGGYLALFID